MSTVITPMPIFKHRDGDVLVFELVEYATIGKNDNMLTSMVVGTCLYNIKTGMRVSSVCNWVSEKLDKNSFLKEMNRHIDEILGVYGCNNTIKED